VNIVSDGDPYEAQPVEPVIGEHAGAVDLLHDGAVVLRLRLEELTENRYFTIHQALEIDSWVLDRVNDLLEERFLPPEEDD
jgi:hypothetical protein